MKVWERLSGAVVAAIALASLMSDAEAVARSDNVDLHTVIAQTKGGLVNDLMAFAYPGGWVVDYLAKQSAPRRPVEPR